MSKRLFFLLLLLSITSASCLQGNDISNKETQVIPTDLPYLETLIPKTSEIPNSTIIQNSNPTATNTIMPTEAAIPTIPLELTGGIQGIPDARLANPELFETKQKLLKNSKGDSSIQYSPVILFAQAMKMRGDEISREQVAKDLQFKMYLNSNNNPIFTYTYFNGQKDYPLLIYDQENELWDVLYLKTAIKAVNERVKYGILGTYYDDNLEKLVRKEAEIIIFENDFKWSGYENQKDVFSSSRKAHIQELINLAKDEGMKIVGGPLLYNGSYPDWIKDLSPAELETQLRTYITDAITTYGDEVDYWIIGNEFEPNYLHGYEDILQDKFKDYTLVPGLSVEEKPWQLLIFAHMISREAAVKNNFDIKLIYNQNHNTAPTTWFYSSTVKAVEILKKHGLIDVVGFQGHSDELDGIFPTAENITSSIDLFGLPTMFTEVDGDDVRSPTRDRYLAQFIRNLDGCLYSISCEAFSIWNIGLEDSYYQEGLGGIIMPTEMYYELISHIFSRINLQEKPD